MVGGAPVNNLAIDPDELREQGNGLSADAIIDSLGPALWVRFRAIGAAHDMAEPPAIARQGVAQPSILSIRVCERR